MRRKKLIIEVFILYILVGAALAFAATNDTNSTETNVSIVNATLPAVPANITNATNSTGNASNVTLTNMSYQQLVEIQQKQIEEMKKQIEIMRAEIEELRKENADLKKQLEELKKKPVTWEDISQTVLTYYNLFMFWTGWIWPLLMLVLIRRYRNPAREEEAERIEEAAEKVAQEKLRQWYEYQVKSRSIEAVCEDETEAIIFRSLGINTVRDLKSLEDNEIVNRFKEKYHPTADVLEHFKNRLEEIRKLIGPVEKKEEDNNAASS